MRLPTSWEVAKKTGSQTRLGLIILAAALASCTSGGDARPESRSEPAAAPPAAAQVSFVPSVVTLNYGTGEMEIRG